MPKRRESSTVIETNHDPQPHVVAVLLKVVLPVTQDCRLILVDLHVQGESDICRRVACRSPLDQKNRPSSHHSAPRTDQSRATRLLNRLTSVQKHRRKERCTVLDFLTAVVCPQSTSRVRVASDSTWIVCQGSLLGRRWSARVDDAAFLSNFSPLYENPSYAPFSSGTHRWSTLTH